MKVLLPILFLTALVTPLWASRDVDGASALIPRAIASHRGAYFLLVVPVNDERTSWIWTAYAMGPTGAFKEIWSGNGVYARHIFLADDGHHVVCVVSPLSGASPKSHVVVGFYDEGKLVQEYRIPDLLQDPEKVGHTWGGYQWLLEPPRLLRSESLYLKVADGNAFELDMTTGKLSPSLY